MTEDTQQATTPFAVAHDANGKPTITWTVPPEKPSSPVSTARYLSMPESAMYGLAADQARALQAPLGWSYVSVLTLYAALGVQVHDQGGEGIRPTLYTALLGNKGAGKSRTIDRAMKMIKKHIASLDGRVELAGHLKDTTPASDRGLYEMFASPDQIAVPWTLVLDEMKDMMQKMAIRGSSLAPVLCSLFYRDRAGSADKSGDHTIHVKLSILGNLKAADPEEFRESFGFDTTAGLFDRFLFAPGPDYWEWDDLWQVPGENWDVEPDIDDLMHPEPLSQPVAIPAFAYRDVAAWRKEVEGNSRGRLGEIALRVAVISAAINGDPEINPDCMKAALRLAEWQEKIRARYSPSSAQNTDAVVSGLVIEALEEIAKRNPERWVRLRDIARQKHWYEKFGAPTLLRVRYALLKEQIIVEERELVNGDELGKATGRIRLVLEGRHA